MAAWLLKEQGYDVIGVTMQIGRMKMNSSSRKKADAVDFPLWKMQDG